MEATTNQVSHMTTIKIERAPAPIRTVTLTMSQSEAQLIRDLLGSTIPKGDYHDDVWSLFNKLTEVQELARPVRLFKSIEVMS